MTVPGASIQDLSGGGNEGGSGFGNGGARTEPVVAPDELTDDVREPCPG